MASNEKSPAAATAAKEMRYTVLPERMPAIPPEKMSEAQRKAVADLVATRGGLKGPFMAIMRCPELMDRIQRLGEYIRYKNFDSNVTPAMMRSSAAQLAAVALRDGVAIAHDERVDGELVGRGREIGLVHVLGLLRCARRRTLALGAISRAERPRAAPPACRRSRPETRRSPRTRTHPRASGGDCSPLALPPRRPCAAALRA